MRSHEMMREQAADWPSLIDVLVNAAPPLSDEQRTRLTGLLAPVAQPSRISPRAPARRAAA